MEPIASVVRKSSRLGPLFERVLDIPFRVGLGVFTGQLEFV
jgi:hypothetical protein